MPASPRPAVTALLLVAGVVCSAWMVWATVSSGHYDDFDVLHDAAVAWHSGRSIYDSHIPDPVPGYPAANLNPPHLTLLMAPLGRLTLRQAAAVSWLGIALAILGCGLVWSRLMPSGWAWRALALVLLTGGSMYAIRLVNTGWPLALAVSLAWLSLRRGRASLAGLIIGCCAATKVFLFLFLPYWVWHRNWRAVAGCIGGAFMVFSAGLLVEGPVGYVRWQHLLGGVTWGWMGANATLTGMLARTLSITPAPSPFAPLAVAPPLLLTALWGLGALGVAGLFFRRFHAAKDLDAEWAAVLLGATLLSPMAWCYYWPMAVGPLAATYARRGAPIWLACLLLVGAVVPFTVFLAPGFTPLGTATAGNAYFWATLAAFAVATRLGQLPSESMLRE